MSILQGRRVASRLSAGFPTGLSLTIDIGHPNRSNPVQFTNLRLPKQSVGTQAGLTSNAGKQLIQLCR